MDPGVPVLPDDELLERFETGRLPAGAFGHREHLRVAHLLLRREGDFGEAAVRFRRALRAVAAARGAADRVHETLTWAWLAVLHAHMRQAPAQTSFDELMRRHPGFLDARGGVLARHYDVDAITASGLARACLVLPDRIAP